MESPEFCSRAKRMVNYKKYPAFSRCGRKPDIFLLPFAAKATFLRPFKVLCR
ncbi:hypothetical protein HMPREF7215_1454 [Pyramidobacter piscolens W5455]|uniref:Uncharacterized protein n=1 Tax=Pyramidobacter piscolens W5455 TaxID=352165 RepID=A0ABM9ZSD5_9BACT|nr:hypothetical protein HMPREF7215_1454 [Pyramidobacter piscolens W5455]